MKRIEVVQNVGMTKGDFTEGIMRNKAFETENLLFAHSRIAGGVKSGWHHHGDRDLYGFMVSGRLRIDYGEEGKESVVLQEGDFFHIPIGIIHRDVNPDIRGAEVISILLGLGPTTVNVPEP